MEENIVIPVSEPPARYVKVWRCRAVDRRTGEVIDYAEVVARSANQARKLAKMRLPNYARIVCEEKGPVAVE